MAAKFFIRSDATTNPNETASIPIYSMKLCLSPFTVDLYKRQENVLLAGVWCKTSDSIKLLKKKDIKYVLQEPRTLTKDQFNNEAEYCKGGNAINCPFLIKN